MVSCHFLLFSLFLLLSPRVLLSVSDTDALLKLKESFTTSNSLDSWTQDTSPCAGNEQWVGVVCFKGIITGLRLGNMGLSGAVDVEALKGITGLRTVSFTNNSLSGPIPEFNKLGALKAIYLTKNNFSGSIPSDFFSKMESLKKVWLSGNGFAGEIPISLSNLPNLIELHLEYNKFSGKIPQVLPAKLTSLDLSYNDLEGEIPASFKFKAESFAGNEKLCGTQLGKECLKMKAPQTKQTLEGQGPMGIEQSVVKTTPDNPQQAKVAVAVVTLTVVLLMLIAAGIIVMKRREEEFYMLGRENLDEPMVTRMTSNRRKSKDSNSRKGGSAKGGGIGIGDLVIVNDEKGVFGLPDLMKAAAEVLGNGSLGSAYKAVMTSGVAVVVKRMQDMNRIGKDGFDGEMRRLGRLRHKNILTPLAYHYRKEEKLVVYEFIPKGSLLYILHGDLGLLHAELTWPTRLKIVKGIARGLGFLHAELASYNLPHGNLKSSNILIDYDFEPRLSDYGFASLVNPAQISQGLFAYRSPESIQYRIATPKCDVYCFGIVILEILTGKFPSQYLPNGKGGTDVVQWVLSAISERREFELIDPGIAGMRNSASEMERLLYIGAACVESNPDNRPAMKDVIRTIEEVQVERFQFQESSELQLSPSEREGYTTEFSSSSSSPSNIYNAQEGIRHHSRRLTG
ncbi:hypothetical protein GIB67_040779 [Kingdonia uniflora]|uniref:Protein kinase domain-containing protein n=1 Tax=Kingdonia uniflora TaxID=39325 RepID=A0A7J7P4A8_9MAGN|nr:hypothetical protein GIB67_040779 [Kingdonia uniflora]